jgi:hypothetical protein
MTNVATTPVPAERLAEWVRVMVLSDGYPGDDGITWDQARVALTAVLPDVLAYAMEQSARLRARQLPPDVCGATDQGSRVVCTLKPHSVELLPRGHPMHRRFHQDWRGGLLWAEWSSVTDDDDEGRLWPDGHIGRRANRP